MQQGHASFWGIATLMFATGIGIPLMATLNSGLGRQIASPYAATFILFGVGILLAGAVMLATGGMPAADKFRGVPPHFYIGAVFVVFYIAAMTWAGPKIGIGNAVFFVLLGQLVASAAVDHFGLWGAVQSSLTGKRAIGIAVMAVGVFLARKTL